MAQIAIDFILGAGISSRLIAYFGQGANGWSHCANVIHDAQHGERYLDARDNAMGGVPAGVHIRDPKTEAWVRKRRATLEVTDAEYEYWEQGLRAHLTTEYDELAILGFLEGKSMHTAGRWICSALAINGIQHLSRTWTPPHLGYVSFPLPVEAHQIEPDAALLIVATAGFTIGPVITVP